MTDRCPAKFYLEPGDLGDIKALESRRMIPPALKEAIDEYAPRVERYRDGFTARGRCWYASDEFAKFLYARGIDAKSWGAWRYQLGMEEERPTEWWQDSGHVVCAVWMEDRTFTVDWTAAQYGYEFPLVREVAELPTENPWLLSEEEASEAIQRLKELTK